MKPSKLQQAIYNEIETGTGSLIVEAVAGSGKTTTSIGCLDRIPHDKQILFLAFNKSIADELKERVPSHVVAKTLNGLGHGALMRAVDGRITLNANKTREIMKEVLTVDDYRDYGDEVKQLVSLSKAYGMVPRGTRYAGLMEDNMDNWLFLVDRFDIDIQSTELPYVIDLTREVLRNGMLQRNVIDFDDQLYMTVLLRANCFKYDFVFVDEAQDVSPIQRALLKMCLKPKGRLIAVGDGCQAIYGFRGADPESLEYIGKEFKAKKMPLSISYRCPQNVVAYAQQYVTHIESSDAAIEGIVQCWPSFDGSEFSTDDLMICRNTAPLVSMAYSLLSRRVPIKVLGRDIGQGLIKLIDKLKPKGLYGEKGLMTRLDQWREAEVKRLQDKGDDDRIQSIDDKYDSINAFVDNSKVDTVEALKEEIETLFNATGDRMSLCTIHKAKGLEADRVFILNPELMPSKYARQDWQMQQEKNLIYVAVTRAKKELVFVRDTDLVSQTLDLKKAVNA